MTALDGQQIADAALEGWANLPGGLATRIRTADFAAGLALVQSIAAAAEEQDHHPDLDLRYSHVDVRLMSHDVRAITERDIRLARTISALAAEAGVMTTAVTVSRFELALDTPDRAKVLPFWGAVLGMVNLAAHGIDDELADPDGVLPAIWFQESGRDEPRQRWHFDVWVDPAEVQARIEAAVAAGGTMVDDEQAPSFWVLADAEGNRVCLCTWQGR